MTRIRKVILFAVALSPAIYAGDGLAFSCVRHIYNESTTCAWKFQAHPVLGNVYFKPLGLTGAGHCGTQCNTKNGPCTIQPKCSYEIKYTYTGGFTRGRMATKIGDVWTSYWAYENTPLGVCPYIKHDGSTGALVLNDPADGDYKISEHMLCIAKSRHR